MICKKIFIRKTAESALNAKSNFPPKVSIFRLESTDASNFRRVFVYFFLRLGISYIKEHSRQISAQRGNVERY